MNLRIFDDHEALSRAAARAIRGSGAKTIGVTGGSTPKRLYEILAESLPENVTWVLVDERHVPKSSPRSNAAMIERTLFGGSPPERWLHFDPSIGTAAETALAFEEAWNAHGLDALDLVLLGCGEDGHTASLFPGTGATDVIGRVGTEVWVPQLDEWRVTLTLPVLRAAKQRLVLVSGAAKANVIREVRDGARHPVTLATEEVETWWMVDADAWGGFAGSSGSSVPRVPRG